MIFFVGFFILKKPIFFMDKTLMAIGISVMLIGIAFGIASFFNPSSNGWFYMGCVLWTLGGITSILGLTILAKEKWFFSVY